MPEPEKRVHDPSHVLYIRIARSLKTAAEEAATSEGVSLSRYVADTLTARLAREGRWKG